MATPQERNEILCSLRPIFPQMDDNKLEECIEIVRRTVGGNRELIIPDCIELLLARTVNLERNPGRDYPGMPIVIEDEVPSYVVNERESSDTDTSEEEIFAEVDDKELMYVATSVQHGERELYLVDDSSSSSQFTSKAGSSFSSPERLRKHQKPSKSVSSTNFCCSTGLSSSPTHRPTLSSCPSSPVADPLRYCVRKIRELLPDVQESYLQGILEKWRDFPVDIMVNNACSYLFENGSYPKEKEIASTCNCPSLPKEDNTDYLKEFSLPVSFTYERQCITLLENEFPMVSVKDIRNFAHKFNYHYAPTRKYLENKIIDSSSNRNRNHTSHSIRLLKTKRHRRVFDTFNCLDPELQKEVDFIKRCKVDEAEQKDRQMASSLNEKQYEEEGQKIECGCCYGEATFEDMIQCLDGHLFCVDCLRNYAKESVFGQGKAVLSCMTSGCDSTFPMSQLKNTLASNILSKYEDRLTEESLCLAEIDNLVRCPSCDFAAILPSDDKVFKCQNASCYKETCRFCKEDWKEHFGLKCNEVEKKATKNIRLSYEERMTMAKIRKCHKCSCEFTKADGCNKMTCRCGTTMCYICRKPGISYAHFCQHPRDPGRKCTSCNNCSLWSDTSEDDDMAVRQLEKEAKEAKRKSTDKNKSETPSKKSRTLYTDTGENLYVRGSQALRAV